MIKLHLRMVSVGGYTYRVLGLRPSEVARFSNNYFHETWHILTHQGGAELLSKILWGLSYQKQPGTIFVIGEDHLVATPFEAEAAKPILLAQDGLARLDDDLLRALRVKLQKTPSTKTVNLQVFGLGSGAVLYKKYRRFHREVDPLWNRERMSLRGGFICYSAPSLILQFQSLSVRRLREHLFMGSNYTYLAEGDWRANNAPQGEVQIFSDFNDRVSSARVARHEILGDNPIEPLLQQKIWDKTELLTRRIFSARKQAKQ